MLEWAGVERRFVTTGRDDAEIAQNVIFFGTRHASVRFECIPELDNRFIDQWPNAPA